jgi:hypothetical protein
VRRPFIAWRALSAQPPQVCNPAATIGTIRGVNGPNPLPANRNTAIAALAATLALAACATSPTAQDAPSAAAAAAPATVGLSVSDRDLTPQEKKVIVDAIAPSLRNAGAAKYRWAKFPTVPQSDQVSYCGIVDAQSPYVAYNGRQAYIVDTKVLGGYITSAVLGLVAGGKDAAIVAGMCEKHGLDPNRAT